MSATETAASKNACADGPPIVADGGMGALISSAVPRIRCPEEANLRAPESVVSLHASFIRAGAELIETNTFGANRRKLAGALPRGGVRADQLDRRRLAREAREVSGATSSSPARSGRSASSERLDAGRAGGDLREQAEVLEGRGVDLFMLETFFDLDELVAAIEAVRARLAPADRRADDLRRGRRRRSSGVSARRPPSGSPSSASAAIGRESRRRPGRGAERARRDAARRARRSPRCRTSASRASPAARVDLPARDARVLRRVRGAGAPARRRASSAAAAARRRRRSRRSAPRSTRTARPRRRSSSRRARARRRRGRRRREETRARANAARGRVRRLRPARPAARRQRPRAARGRRACSRESGKAHFVDVNDNPRARARMSGIMASVAIERACGIETIPHLTPRDTTDRRARVAPARRARRGRPQHARRDRRPAGGGRLPGLARRLRGRRDRADAADRAA